MKGFARKIREAVRRNQVSEHDRVLCWQVRLRLAKQFEKPDFTAKNAENAKGERCQH